MFAPNLAGVAAAREEINQRALAAGPGHGRTQSLGPQQIRELWIRSRNEELYRNKSNYSTAEPKIPEKAGGNQPITQSINQQSFNHVVPQQIPRTDAKKSYIGIYT